MARGLFFWVQGPGLLSDARFGFTNRAGEEDRDGSENDVDNGCGLRTRSGSMTADALRARNANSTKLKIRGLAQRSRQGVGRVEASTMRVGGMMAAAAACVVPR